MITQDVDSVIEPVLPVPLSRAFADAGAVLCGLVVPVSLRNKHWSIRFKPCWNNREPAARDIRQAVHRDAAADSECLNVNICWRGLDATLRVPAQLPRTLCSALLPARDTATFDDWPKPLRSLFVERAIQWLIRWMQIRMRSTLNGGLVLKSIERCRNRQGCVDAIMPSDGDQHASEPLIATLSNEAIEYDCVLRAPAALFALLAAALGSLRLPRIQTTPLSAPIALAGRLIRRCVDIGVDELRSLRPGDVVLYHGALMQAVCTEFDETLPDIAELSFDEAGDGMLPVILARRAEGDVYRIVDCHWSERPIDRALDHGGLGGAIRMQASVALGSVNMTVGSLRELTVDAQVARLSTPADSARLFVAGQPVAAGRLVRIGNRGGLLVTRISRQ